MCLKKPHIFLCAPHFKKNVGGEHKFSEKKKKGNKRYSTVITISDSPSLSLIFYLHNNKILK